MHYNSQTNEVIKQPPRPIENYPDWEWIDCICCGGTKWSILPPTECEICGGKGFYAKHKKTGVTKDYPSGKFV